MIAQFLKEAVAYPFRGNGKFILLWGAILGVFADLVSLAGVLGFIAGLFLMAYFCAIFFEIMTSSATGHSTSPGFPNLSDYADDIIFPFFKVTGCSIVSFGPLFAYEFGVSEESYSPVIAYVLLFAGAVYFPMAILAVGILNMFTAMLPHIVFPAIFRAGGLYWVVVAILFVVLMLSSSLEEALGGTLIIGALVMAFVSMLTLMINGRLLGLLYHEKAEDLNWL